MGVYPAAPRDMSYMCSGVIVESVLPAISITAAARGAIAREAWQSSKGLETGGILLGTDISEQITIRHAGGLGPNARRGPRTFLRDLDHVRQLAGVAWRRDQSQWIGEWYTHLSAELIPSALDLASYLRHLYDPELCLERFVALLVGLDIHRGITVVAWLIDRNRVNPLPLRRSSD